MLTNIFDLATYTQLNPNLIESIELLFANHGMVCCGRLQNVDEADLNEYIIDPQDFRLRELYDRRMPKTHFFAVYNVKPACPIPTKVITTFTMNEDDENEYMSFMPELVERRNRSLAVQMKLRSTKFTI